MIPNYSLVHSDGEWGSIKSGSEMAEGEITGYGLGTACSGYFSGCFNGLVTWFNLDSHYKNCGLDDYIETGPAIEKYDNVFCPFPKGTVITLIQE